MTAAIAAGLVGMYANPATAGTECDEPQWIPTIGTNGAVTALAYMSNGDLIAGGDFTQIEGTPARHVAIQRNGVWSQLGDGLDSAPASITALSNGHIVAAGSFPAIIDGMPSTWGVALFDGTNWQPLGPTSDPSLLHPLSIIGYGSILESERSVKELSNGHIIAAGAYGIAEWDGSAWIPLARGTCCSGVWDVLPLPSSNFAVTGGFEGGLYGGDPSGALRIAQYDGFGWSAIGYGLSRDGFALTRMLNGDIIVGGTFTGRIETTPAGRRVLRWDGSAWNKMGDGLGNMLLAGRTSMVTELVTMPNGDVIAGGQFVNAATSQIAQVNHIARWNGTSWLPIGLGVDGPDRSDLLWLPVTALAVAPNGTLAVGGTLTTAGGQPSAYLAFYGCPRPGPTCSADFNGDSVRDVADLFAYINAWLAKTANADFNNDTTVDVADLFAYINAWLAGC